VNVYNVGLGGHQIFDEVLETVKQLGLWIACLMIGAITLCGQTSGTINGTVRDASGALVPGANIDARSTTSGERRKTTSSERGAYTLPFLPPGDYQLEVSRDGFSTAVIKATLNVADVIAVDVALKVSSSAERIEVTSSVPLLQTENSALGRVVEGSTVFTQLLALSPGTSGPLNDAGALGRGTQNISSGGARLGSNSIYIDGVDAVNIHSNTANENAFASNGLVAPSPEAIQEFKVQTGLYDATSGRSGGAAVVLVTKSGGPQFHETLFEFFRNNELNANSFFFNITGQSRPVLKQNQFGGNLGGPVRILSSPEQPINGITTNTTANSALRVPYVGFSPTGLVWLETSTDSRYN